MLEIGKTAPNRTPNPILERQPLLTRNIGVENCTYRRRAGKRSFENRMYQKAAEDQIGHMPEPGETLHMVVSVSYRTVDLIPAWLALEGQPIAELYIATLSFNRGCLDLILELIDQEQVERFAFVVSTFSKNLEPAMWNYAVEQIRGRGHRIVAMFNHCKVICARFADGAAYTAEGSANIRSHGGRGDDVYDPFLGTGTTIMAAESLGRVAYGFEVSPNYAAVILQRTKDAGLTPKLASLTPPPETRKCQSQR